MTKKESELEWSSMDMYYFDLNEMDGINAEEINEYGMISKKERKLQKTRKIKTNFLFNRYSAPVAFNFENYLFLSEVGRLQNENQKNPSGMTTRFQVQTKKANSQTEKYRLFFSFLDFIVNWLK